MGDTACVQLALLAVKDAAATEILKKLAADLEALEAEVRAATPR